MVFEVRDQAVLHLGPHPGKRLVGPHSVELTAAFQGLLMAFHRVPRLANADIISRRTGLDFNLPDRRARPQQSKRMLLFTGRLAGQLCKIVDGLVDQYQVGQIHDAALDAL